ncbi:SDR family oxidoreductase [Kyrpidia tusciae]|uniref:Short-chain dehydrogenase/reductase SDR n=1 Tax=Kyrpidia tusciae (strain DSM 2912 / NBRC 15312 / T2) TaxID=562970 RepID=D5WQR0_KYRT2|nr:SDR family oxidoreductase [Kyrpidia tusciae]ADG06669.1 short-chain dehydrogenase/reductase SDR [Kyrpidia tusciae DSM 2912]
MKVLVTGGIAGLGRAVAERLVRSGHEVVVTYRRDRAEVGEQSDGDLKKAWGLGAVRAVQCDAGSRQQVDRWLSREHDFDCWIHAVGPFRVTRTPLVDTAAGEWEELVAGNLHSAYWHARWLIPHMRGNRFGRVVTFGYPQIEGGMPWEGRGAYAGAKAGLLSFTRTLAAEEAPYGITVNMVCPGDIRDPFKEGAIVDARNQAGRLTAGSTPAGRPATGEDVARVVEFLCHPDSDMVTGSVIYVTGGVQYFPFTY